MSRGNFIVCVVFSLWTFIQTSLHLVFVIYTYYMSICQISPTQENAIFFYLTYLYNKNCDAPKLQASSFTALETVGRYFFNFGNQGDLDSGGITVEDVVKELLDKLEYFPDYAEASSRTSIFLLSFLILDGAWLVTAVALLMGTCFEVKQSLSLFYYSPWLVMTVCICIFDAAATILFGLDMSQTTNFTNWMKFVGIKDSSEFDDLDAKNLSTFIPLAPSLAISSVSGRFIIIWILNWVAFFCVMRATVSVYREKEVRQSRRQPVHHLSPIRSQMDLDTSAARIRNWQLFYGAIETHSTMSSTSSERDHNSNSKEGKGVHVGFQNNERVPPVNSNVSTYYHAYPDVAESIDGAGGVCLDELRGQLPWSYIATQEDTRKSSGGEAVELDNRNRKLFRLKSDSSASGTEM